MKSEYNGKLNIFLTNPPLLLELNDSESQSTGIMEFGEENSNKLAFILYCSPTTYQANFLEEPNYQRLAKFARLDI